MQLQNGMFFYHYMGAYWHCRWHLKNVIQPIPSLLHWQLERLALIQEHVIVTSLSGSMWFSISCHFGKNFPFSVSFQSHNSRLDKSTFSLHWWATQPASKVALLICSICSALEGGKRRELLCTECSKSCTLKI